MLDGPSAFAGRVPTADDPRTEHSLADIELKARMEAYSTAYAHAIAAAAGVAVGSIRPDINGLDVHFLSPDDGTDAGTAAHVQLKSTAEQLTADESGNKTYRLRHVDYDRLRLKTSVPRVLVVVEVPRDPQNWITCEPERLLLHASARWASVRGEGPTEYAESSKIPVVLPAANTFTPAALRDAMGSLNAR